MYGKAPKMVTRGHSGVRYSSANAFAKSLLLPHVLLYKIAF